MRFYPVLEGCRNIQPFPDHCYCARVTDSHGQSSNRTVRKKIRLKKIDSWFAIAQFGILYGTVPYCSSSIRIRAGYLLPVHGSLLHLHSKKFYHCDCPTNIEESYQRGKL